MLKWMPRNRKARREDFLKEPAEAEGSVPEAISITQTEQEEPSPAPQPDLDTSLEEEKQETPEPVSGNSAGESGDNHQEQGGEHEEASSMASLFAQDGQGEESSASTMLDLVPETTVEELIDCMEEIKTMVKPWLPEE
jgi:hypothetical protein